MTDDRIQPNPTDRPEVATPEQAGRDAQQPTNIPGAPAQGGQPSAPGRKPLFRS